jgi:hypothetical protein
MSLTRDELGEKLRLIGNLDQRLSLNRVHAASEVMAHDAALREQLAHVIEERELFKMDYLKASQLTRVVREQLEAMTQDYEAAQHLADATSREWQQAKQQLADAERDRDALATGRNGAIEDIWRLTDQLAQVTQERESLCITLEKSMRELAQ